MPHFLDEYNTPMHACFAVMDEFGNLIPCNKATMLYIFPHNQMFTNWG